MKVSALQLNICWYWQLLFFQYRMDFTETACVCALLLRIRKVHHKSDTGCTTKATLGAPQKRHWVHPIVSKGLLEGQFYIFYKDFKNCQGKFFTYFSMIVESFDKLLVLIGPRITYENSRLHLSVPPQERMAVKLM